MSAVKKRDRAGWSCTILSEADGCIQYSFDGPSSTVCGSFYGTRADAVAQLERQVEKLNTRRIPGRNSWSIRAQRNKK